MAQINFRIDDDVKTEAEELFSRIGMNMSTAIMVFIRQALAEDGIPFRIHAGRNEAGYRRFMQAGRDYDNGRVNYHYHELPEDEEVQTEKCRAQVMA